MVGRWNPLHWPALLAILLVGLYQKTLSPDHSWLRHLFPGGFCRFTPSCSMYTRLALEKYGFIRGSAKGLWRILRCNPWSKGGLDLP
ncbi:membrane protein insertion efficiency factor YidD [Candidatus Peregrinibacteria bacterium]|nr:MAG: membrane protein insertion efficiency factor YidD [Candidatus Peregrinibacteria bacterium]